MDIARVVGTVTMTVKHPVYAGRKVMLVRPLGAPFAPFAPGAPGAPGAPAGPAYAAVDLARAGVGDTVLVNREGSAAREVLGDGRAPVRSLIVGVVDAVDAGGNTPAGAAPAGAETGPGELGDMVELEEFGEKKGGTP